MPKRKDTEDDSDSDDNKSIINIDFDFFDFTPTDFKALKHMFAQLFQADAELLHIHDLAELVLTPPMFGTTVKTDTMESDPYAFLTVLNLTQHKDHVAVKALVEYALAKSAPNQPFRTALQSILATKTVGLILSERLINMPVQIVPPMYRIFSEEIQSTTNKGFDYFLCISRTYRISAGDANAMEGVESTGPPPKRQKGKPAARAPSGLGTYSYHPEDEVLEKYASYSMNYEFTHKQVREEDAFGADIGGKLMLIPADKLKEVVDEMAERYTVYPYGL